MVGWPELRRVSQRSEESNPKEVETQEEHWNRSDNAEYQLWGTQPKKFLKMREGLEMTQLAYSLASEY